MQTLNFVWLELTGACQLACRHCYAESGPTGTHGTMSAADWRRVIDQAATLGVSMVQFIGGEPTLHPDLAVLIDHALHAGLEVEVFSNLAHISPPLWQTFSRPGVGLATSYYSDDAAEHEAITGRRGSHARTRANIAEAVRRSIPLRAGVIDIRDGQRVSGALTQLSQLGVTNISTDRLRQVGRGQRDRVASVDQLCGNCASGVLAVAPDGTVWPCVFTRWLPVGNVRHASLVDILAGECFAQTANSLQSAFDLQADKKCGPDAQKCPPDSRCDPSKTTCQPHCPPSNHAPPKRCWPYYYDERKRST